jgi:glycosyltransferase involved in cell wall biosynthesis
MTEYPRILFVTPCAFNHLTGTGITFSNLFHGWPKDRLATVHNDPVPTTDDVCDRYFVLGSDEIDLFGPLRLIRALTMLRANGTASTVSAARPPARGGIVTRLHGDSAPRRVRISDALARFIADFKPDLLFSTLGNNAFIELTTAIRRRFEVPMIVHMMDDFPSASHWRGVFAPLELARMRRNLADVFDAATVRMGICADMCTAYAQRYGRPFTSFANCVDIERWRPFVRSHSAVSATPPRLVYFGSVLPFAQHESLADICRSVVRLNETGTPVRFDIMTPLAAAAPYRSALALHDAVRLIEPTEDDHEYFATLVGADVLVLPVNFDPHTMAYVRFSMPTKVPAYMASGTPILVYGPRGVAQVEYAQREGWGHVVSERDPATLDDALRRVLADAALRERLRLRAQTVADANHDSKQVRTNFQDVVKIAARTF